jgi:hypothetical protein
MFLLLAAQAVFVCPSGATPDQILDANRVAMQSASRASTMSATFSYRGQGLTGASHSTIDLQEGRFIEETAIGPTTGATGFDGRTAWMRDLSGVTSPQEGGDKPALAVNAAYRNVNRWWRPDRGGAAIEMLACDRLRITPPNGVAFEASFDPTSHLLATVREDQSFGVVTSTSYSRYERRGGHLVPTLIATITGDDPGTQETLSLSNVTFGKPRAAAWFAMPATVRAHWALPPSGRVTVPIRLLNNHVVVDVRIDGHGPFPFLVDTGGHDIVTPATAKALGIVSQGATPTFGAGDKPGSNGYAHLARIDVGGAALSDQTVITLDFSPVNVEGLQLGGMLGVEFIERFVVRLDYGAKTMTLIDTRRFGAEERAAAGAPVPFLFYSHMPQVAGRIDGRAARLDIDTGSRAEVTLTAPFVARAGLRQAYPDGVTITDGWGVGGASHSYVVRLGSLSLGSVAAANPIAGLSSASVGAFADRGSEANVGSGLLKRSVVTFDYVHKTMYLKPLAHPDQDTGRFDKVGFWLNVGRDGLEVMDLAPGGPADAAGLKVGDVVTTLGGLPVAGRVLSDVRRELKLVEVGRPFPIGYRRGNTTALATVTPRDLIPDVGR